MLQMYLINWPLSVQYSILRMWYLIFACNTVIILQYVIVSFSFMCAWHVGGTASEMALAEVALNILCLLMKEQWSWLCSENIQRTIKLLFGTFINR